MTVNFILGKYVSSQYGDFSFEESIVVLNSSTNTKNKQYIIDETKKLKQTLNESANYHFSIYPSLASFKNGAQPIGHANLHLSKFLLADVDILQELINSNNTFTDFTQQTMRL